MKKKLIILGIGTLLLFSLSSCTEILTCVITSPNHNEKFSENEPIYVIVEASTNKGSVIQVQILVDNEIKKSFTKPPYCDTIRPRYLTKGIHSISAEAYSSGGNMETDAFYITIKE